MHTACESRKYRRSTRTAAMHLAIKNSISTSADQVNIIAMRPVQIEPIA